MGHPGPVGSDDVTGWPLTTAHVDLDAFFAAVEQRDKPSLRGRAVVVGGLGRRGVVATANYPARVLGVHSAMPMWQARRHAPGAAFLAGRMPAYRQHSQAIWSAVGAADDLVRVLEQVGVDEAYLALGAPVPDAAAAARWGRAVQDLVWDATGLTCSVGIGTTKLAAKLASGRRKPFGVTPWTTPQMVAEIGPGPLSILPGAGPVTAGRLAAHGIRTVHDLAGADPDLLREAVGTAHAAALAGYAHGLDARVVAPPGPAKSASSERTWAQDLTRTAEVERAVTDLAASAHARLLGARVHARTVAIKVRYGDFTELSRQTTLPEPTSAFPGLVAAAQELAAQVPLGIGIRLLGVGYGGLTSTAQLALDLAADRTPSVVADPVPTGPPLAGTDDELDDGDEDGGVEEVEAVGADVDERSQPGTDVVHPAHGRGWLLGVRGDSASVRFEHAGSEPARTRGVRLTEGLRHVSPAAPGPPAGAPPWAPAPG